MNKFFEEFEPANYQSWLQLVEKELKTPLEPYSLIEGILANPFVENKNDSQISGFSKPATGWVISQKIKGENSGNLNKNILEALNGGVSGITIPILNENFDFETSFQEVVLSFIIVRFNFENPEINLPNFLKKLEVYISGKDSNLIFAGLDESQAELIKDFGKFEIESSENGNLITNLSETLRKAEVLAFEKGINVCINIPSVENFYLNIAQTKALRIIWNKIAEAYEKPEMGIFLFSEIKSNLEDPNTQVISATQQAAAAIIGGTEAVEIANIPFSNEAYPENFAPRITRNIQNVLWNESFLYRVNDPANGSYFIDDLCNKMIKEIWTLFIKDK